MSTDDRTRILPGRAETGVGTQLSGIYELDERIASGGMGEVYRGHNIQTGDFVAIKIVLPEFARDQTILSLFRKEASILNHLSHEAVVRYHVFTVDPTIGRPYLAMEYVDGQSLFDVLRDGPMAPEEALRLCHRLASGLSAVHRAGAIHRDLSPDNVILPGGHVERAKIIDFGIARLANVGGETLIGGRFAGKYNYVSPEQLGLYGGEVSEKSDIYSLGLVLAAALRGRPLDMTGSQVDVVEKRRLVPDLSGIEGDMRPIIQAMLQPDPRDRPASMAEIVRMCRQTADAREEWDEDELAAKPWTGLGRKSHGEDGVVDEARPAPFVEHVRPAYISKPKPKPAPLGRKAERGRRRGMGGATVAGVVLVLLAAAGAGMYFAGLVPPGRTPVPSDGEKTTTLLPERSPARKEVASTGPAVAPAPPPVEPSTPHKLEEGTSASRVQPTPEPNPPASPPPNAAAGGNSTAANGLQASEIIKRFLEQTRKKTAEGEGTKPTERPAPAPEVATPAAKPPETTAASTPTPPRPGQPAEPAPGPNSGAPPPGEEANASAPKMESAVEKQLPGWTRLPPLSGRQSTVTNDASKAATSEPKEANSASPRMPESALQSSPSPVPDAGRPSEEIASSSKAGEPVPNASQSPTPAPAAEPVPTPPQVETRAPAPRAAGNAPETAMQPPPLDGVAARAPDRTEAQSSAAPRSAPAPSTADGEAPARRPPAPVTQPTPSAQPGSGQSGGDVVAMNVPRPSTPPATANPLEQTVSWLRAYPGGDCFYAAPDDASDGPIGIVGFGTAPEPFVKLMKAFQGKFGREPDIQVRLISPAQCEVTRFMQGLASPTADIQSLTLDRTSVANGSPISGVLKTQGGLRSNLLLIDHDGMTYNLDRLLIVEGDTAKFNARIELDPGSRAKGKPMPEIVLAITGSVDLRSASTLQSAPASQVLPRIRREIQESGGTFAATAKYFQLGG